MNDTNINNIATLFESKRIVIPVIQRDYAQGRENEQINSIRSNFIDSLFDAVEEDKIMDINYIYGINKADCEFLPIDGQQRLTSIFLFLWFCAVKEGKTSDFRAKVKSFSYMVRRTSEAFFAALQRAEDGDLKYLEDFKNYVETDNCHIQDFSWFRINWKNDMTVDGVIRFLDAVKEKSKKYFLTSKSYTDKLLDPDKCPISLMLVVQNEVSDLNLQSEEKEKMAFEAENRAAVTYINMNERGKILNDFENLKNLIHKKGGEEFIKKYDQSYINIFLEELERQEFKGQKNNLSFAQKVSKMDRLTLNFMVNVFYDLRLVESSKQQSDVGYSDLRLREDLEESQQSIFPDRYFEFMQFVLENYKEFSDEEKTAFFEYCDNHTRRNRYNFYVRIWADFTGLKKDTYWGTFSKHLFLRPLPESESVTNERSYKFYMRLVNILSSETKPNNSGLLDILRNIGIEELYTYVTENYNNIIDKATLFEEKIKAALKSASVGKADYQNIWDELERCGEKRNHKVRYLLYFSDLWEEAACKEKVPVEVKDENWEKLKIFLAVDQQVFVSNFVLSDDLYWRKLYYLSWTENETHLPCDKDEPSWKENWLVWDKIKIEDVNQQVLDKVKWCYEKIAQQPDSDLKEIIEEKKIKIGTNREIWLYYLLKRDYPELFGKNIRDEKGQYEYRVGTPDRAWMNYYEYVLKLDLKQKDIAVKYKGDIDKVKSLVEKPIAPKEGDGFVNTKNMKVILSLKCKIKDEPDQKWQYIHEENTQSIYRFKFNSFDSNHEDCFLVKKDNRIMREFDELFEKAEKEIDNVLVTCTEDDFYKCIFEGDCGAMQKKINECVSDVVKESIPSFSCKKMGQRDIVITAELNKEICQTESERELKTHSEVVQMFH